MGVSVAFGKSHAQLVAYRIIGIRNDLSGWVSNLNQSVQIIVGVVNGMTGWRDAHQAGYYSSLQTAILIVSKNSVIPMKKKKGIPHTAEAKTHNKALSKRRILIENINRLGKIFRCVKEVYRGKHKNYGLTWRLVAALVNLRCSSI